MVADLFPRVDSLLPWLPGETLFSLCSRHHRLWGYRLSSRSSEVMFGGRRIGTQHDLPSGLDAFALRTDGHLGSAVEIARDRTMLRFYRAFLAQSEIDFAIWSMRGSSVAHLKYRLGLLTSRFRANHPLKACIACMQDDLSVHGWVYWHQVHQFPGVWICPIHALPLRTSRLKSTGVERFLWHLPAESQLEAPWQDSDATQTLALQRLSMLTIALVGHNREDGYLHADSVQRTLRARFQERGWLTSGGYARLTDAATGYLQHCALLRLPHELACLPTTQHEASVQIGRLIRPLRSGVHPIRLLVAIDWLFTDLDDFLEQHKEAARSCVHATSEEGTSVIEKAADERALREQVSALMSSGVSASAAAKEVSIDVSTAMAWAAASGVQVRRRPKVLKPELRASLVRCLLEGMNKGDAAGRHGISVGTVTRLLQTEVGLHAAWKAAQTATSQRQARSSWLSLATENPNVGVKILRSIDPASYAWLYRHDRAWLMAHTPDRSLEATAVRQSPVRWDERDRSISIEVTKAVERLAVAGRSLKLWQIYQAIPHLKPKLTALHRMPLTRQVLEHALAHRQPGKSSDLLQERETDSQKHSKT